ncbi:epimerase [Gammaproteobacteria bacterium 42_54_T18]|nr:epimerase [Gammaproteobacteria bacterium 42_54_T18]
MATYLVTGGCGFIGSHLVKNLLNDGHNVRVLDNLSVGRADNIPDSAELVIGSVTDKYIVRSCMWGVDGCFHLASCRSKNRSHEGWLSTHNTNVAGSINVFITAGVNRTPVVYASSYEVYGDNADTPLKENSLVSPLSSFGVDKLGVELQARVASLEHGVPTTGLRFFNVYGNKKGHKNGNSGVISKFQTSIDNDCPLIIFGDGKQIRDFVFVNDAVVFLRTALEKVTRAPSIFNVCSGKPISMNSLAQMMMTINSVNRPIRYQKRERGDIRLSVGDPRKSISRLGVVAKQPLVRGIRSLIDKNLICGDV